MLSQAQMRTMPFAFLASFWLLLFVSKPIRIITEERTFAEITQKPKVLAKIRDTKHGSKVIGLLFVLSIVKTRLRPFFQVLFMLFGFLLFKQDSDLRVLLISVLFVILTKFSNIAITAIRRLFS